MAQDHQRAENRWQADLQRAEKRRVAALHTLQVARRERDDLYLAYRQEIPFRNSRVGAFILADFVLQNQS
ncbi:hypothetical protein LIER_31185 [Lithospermum erythrorhizon]|uniref:Uncharacterized protein n=1 Tax=Lithospermum erythrorhizon TaxID=34254 RepID=A0AAV3RS62_LITER